MNFVKRFQGLADQCFTFEEVGIKTDTAKKKKKVKNKVRALGDNAKKYYKMVMTIEPFHTYLSDLHPLSYHHQIELCS